MATGLHDAETGRDWHADPDQRHLVQFYESDDYLLEMLSQSITRTLSNQEASIVVATSRHVESLRARLSQAGIDVPAAIQRGQFTALDITSTMSRFMRDGSPDPGQFERVFSPVLDQASRKWSGVHVFGEMVALTAESNDQAATIKLEELWNDLLDKHAFKLYCAYPLSAFSHPETQGMVEAICDQHSAVYPAESYSPGASTEEQFQTIALLQQKAARLEVEIENRKQAEERLHEALDAEREARREAEAALRLRDEFVSVAAHELKTPLTSLMGRAQYLLRARRLGSPLESEHVTQAMESVVSQADKLSRLITQLLDVSRLKGGKLTIERRLCDVAELIRESCASVRSEIEAYDIALDLPDSLTTNIDPLRMEQVFVNLLNNAVKYSPVGGTIEIELTANERDGIEIAVRDYGPGIPPENRDQIFERFYQADHQPGPRSGLGLGLYISREIVELHDGSLRVEFPEGGGTRFVVSLPARVTPDAKQLD